MKFVKWFSCSWYWILTTLQSREACFMQCRHCTQQYLHCWLPLPANELVAADVIREINRDTHIGRTVVHRLFFSFPSVSESQIELSWSVQEGNVCISIYSYISHHPQNPFKIQTKHPILTKLQPYKLALSLFSHAAPPRWQIHCTLLIHRAAQLNNFTKNGLICSTKINSQHNADCSALRDHKAEQSVLPTELVANIDIWTLAAGLERQPLKPLEIIV